ncbi:hypothetical protein TYRP_003453 [Tyrophagus putrescentiae]|nr:hypothetical protein TYRP_003453 [Tyrophagus putrescentiae]
MSPTNCLFITIFTLLFAVGFSSNLVDWLHEPKWGPSPSERAWSITAIGGWRRPTTAVPLRCTTAPPFPTWQLSCATFHVFNCYLLNAKYYCQEKGSADFLSAYTTKFGDFLERSIAGTVRFIGGQPSCGQSTHDSVAAYYNKTVEEKGFKSHRRRTGPRLPQQAGHYSGSTDHQSQCLTAALDLFDQHRRKLFESAISDACCALYSVLDCVQAQAGSVCSPPEQSALALYRTKATLAYGNSVCAAVPYSQAGSLCSRSTRK